MAVVSLAQRSIDFWQLAASATDRTLSDLPELRHLCMRVDRACAELEEPWILDYVTLAAKAAGWPLAATARFLCGPGSSTFEMEAQPQRMPARVALVTRLAHAAFGVLPAELEAQVAAVVPLQRQGPPARSGAP